MCMERVLRCPDLQKMKRNQPSSAISCPPLPTLHPQQRKNKRVSQWAVIMHSFLLQSSWHWDAPWLLLWWCNAGTTSPAKETDLQVIKSPDAETAALIVVSGFETHTDTVADTHKPLLCFLLFRFPLLCFPRSSPCWGFLPETFLFGSTLLHIHEMQIGGDGISVEADFWERLLPVHFRSADFVGLFKTQN